ncbi:DsbA family protein [Bosea sp. ANAM02]|uniref:DsbA family protein n=1 Tax=Bosea sp. ANAM02 TaxID=2020412 RepID=UPI00140F1E51|nr:DsbA family protein [Bosea sp. ANAM02]BCB22361.1 hypothetical protein OCUBac02_52550 [Bosea sp. ANAM02]
MTFAVLTRRGAIAGIAAALTASTTLAQAEDPPAVTLDKLLEATDVPDLWIGDPTAKVTIVEYASLTCTHCARFHEDVWPELRKRYVDTGKIRFVLREFPLDPLSLAAFMLARAAGADRREAYVDAFFRKQSEWAFNGRPLDTMPALTAQLGMKREEFDAVLKNEALLTSISQVRVRAQSQFGVNSTPTFFVGTERLVGARPIANFEAAIAAQG